MAALVQAFPQQSSTVTMLQSRSTSPPSPFQTAGHMQQTRGSQVPRSVYNGTNTAAYRTPSSMPPVASYAFTTAPHQHQHQQQPAAPFLRQENRTASAPAVPHAQQFVPSTNQTRPQQTGPGASSARVPGVASAMDLAVPSSNVSASKPSPDRYRRNHRRVETTQTSLSGGSAQPSGSGMATVSHLYNQSPQGNPSSSAPPGPTRVASTDDIVLHRQPATEQARRYRRRSISSIGADDYAGPHVSAPQQRSYAAVASAPYGQKPYTTSQSSSSHGRKASEDSVSSARSTSRPSSSKRDASGTVTANPAAVQQAKLVNIPPRASSDAIKRLTNPSPLSKPMAMSPTSPTPHNQFQSPAPSSTVQAPSPPPPAPSASGPARAQESPAAQHLAALNRKKEGKPSRLRRAFSFGSAAELRKASAENSHVNNERSRLQKARFNDDPDAREAAIVQQQEAAGLGENIYSGQGHFFTGSTDNLSVSSTASSASVMLRKMGKGMKKSTRSLVGLFRPKSVIGVPAADAAVPEQSAAQVSIVTVEAEREKVNVNASPHDQAGGGTGFPKLGRNSLDAASLGTASLGTSETAFSLSDRSSNDARSRRSIVGGEKERAEVLAAVKKGILKRNGTDSGNSSPVHRPADLKPEFVLPQIPRFDSPVSSAPSTPGEETAPRGGLKRPDSVTIEGEDYFMSVTRFAASDSKSLPGTPRSQAQAVRNITFSPRIQFHDTWPSQEYDRRGEISTCNRLTPTLAQAIKEELNSFKMEMEVHESSKVYTHFF